LLDVIEEVILPPFITKEHVVFGITIFGGISKIRILGSVTRGVSEKH
jgi:hypothetical protein